MSVKEFVECVEGVQEANSVADEEAIADLLSELMDDYAYIEALVRAFPTEQLQHLKNHVDYDTLQLWDTKWYKDLVG